MFLKRAMSTVASMPNMNTKVMKLQQLKNQPNYEACIELLNGLQSNAQYLKAKTTNPTPGGSHSPNQLIEVAKYLERSGLSAAQLDGLSVIHVAGTKGKGMTCAFSESILRNHGYSVGFFSSPHLLEVRERIRINGAPIDREQFAQYFWRIYSALDERKNNNADMPLYFRFLTIMAFMIFVEAKVDVAIIEVGIGGEYDCTNVLKTVPVIGITSLGIDHTALLGNTIESIAWNKAGIMKRGCWAFTVPQPDSALAVLRERSKEKECQLKVVDCHHFKFPSDSTCPVNILNLNASLAVALCDAWIRKCKGATLDPEITQKALASCHWPGRFQVKQDKNITYYLDGAHTMESIEICSNWFQDITRNSPNKRVLMFNVTGDRDPSCLLKLLQKCHFNGVVFVTNNAKRQNHYDNINYALPRDSQLIKCQRHKEIWLEQENDNTAETAEFVKTFPTVLEAIEFLNKKSKINLLVTGSLHLIGAILSLIEPQLNDNVTL